MIEVTRPEQHQTDSQGKALLRDTFARLGWTVNEISEDYGRDFEVEVFRNAQSTGITFSVQLKSSVAPAYSAAGDFVSQELDRSNADYLASKMRHPVLLIVADVAQRRLFWAAPQTDKVLLKTLGDRPDAKTCTVRVPVANELPATMDRLIETLGRVQTFLASRCVMEVPHVDFAASVEGRLPIAALSENLRDKSDFLDLRLAEELAVDGHFEAARTKVQGVLSSQQSSTEMKFFALLVGEKVETLAITMRGAPQPFLSRLRMETAIAMQRLTRKGPPHLKFYALLARSAAEFYDLAQQDCGLYLNWKAHEREGDLWWRTGLIFERAALARRLERKYNQFVRLARYVAASPHRSALPLALLLIIEGVSILIARLESEGLIEAATSYRASTLQFCKFAAYLATESDDDDALVRSALAATSLTRDHRGECFQWALAALDKIRDQETRRWGRETIERLVQRLQGVDHPDDAYQSATDEQIYHYMAAAFGIDLADPNDEAAQMVRIGIADLDPSRVLRDCEHLFVTLGVRGLIADWLRLPTMGQKVIHCTLHRYSVAGWTLDGAYRSFKGSYCENCADRLPRPSDWQYSPEWQEAENERHKEYMEHWRGPTRRRLPPLPLPPDIQRQMENKKP